MDIYSNDSAGIQQGAMRTQSVMNANQRVKEHNDALATTISGLRSQQQTAGILDATKNATSQFWATGKIPGQVKAFNDWNTSRQASNPTSQAEGVASEGLEGATQTPKTSSAVPELEDVGDGVFESGGKSAITGAEDVAEGVGSKLGKGLGTLGSVATAGVDIYQDIDSLSKGHGIAGDNWASKTSNLLQIGGAIADVGGTVFPPLAIVGGAVDLVAGGFGELGDVLSGKKSSAADDTALKTGTETTTAITTESADTGRVS
tara:strand:+ start:1583 stop:2365 length:783 start_codon:yes stop_codon:yes gene_type:complete